MGISPRTLLTTSAISRMSVQRGRFVRAKKSSIIRVPILYPLVLVMPDAHTFFLAEYLLAHNLQSL